ncbi:MAG TPA: hypothetical protein VF572_07280 [Candidatus Saccharimonadales bacterium]|jgi:hypothetical protein
MRFKSSYKDIERAMSAAPVIAEGTTRIPFVPSVVRKVANAVIVRTSDELLQVSRLSFEVRGEPADESWIEESVPHEIQHGAAVTAVGGSVAGYGISYAKYRFDDGQESLGAQPFILPKMPWRTTLLMDMAVTAHPEAVSPGDIDDLEKYGFDVDRVGVEIEHHNRHAPRRKHLPLPMSYRRREYFM